MKKDAPRPRRPLSTKGKLLFMGVLFAVGLGATEGVMRVVTWAKGDKTITTFTDVNHKTYTAKEWAEVFVMPKPRKKALPSFPSWEGAVGAGSSTP